MWGHGPFGSIYLVTRGRAGHRAQMKNWPNTLPAKGIGETEALAQMSDAVRTGSAQLGAATALAHMDPPPPAFVAELVGLNARYNQNLLHPDLSPLATHAEARVIDWLAPAFGMTCGHMCAGSSLGNLTALWAAREAGATRVVASADAHLSVGKAAHILGLPFECVAVDDQGRMHAPADLSDAALVLTSGTTGRGAIDPLSPTQALWTHVDAAWAGPLILTKYADRLAGIERADSVAVSAHKWLYQPKDAALILFRDPNAQAAISFGGSYLSVLNIGVQGSRSAAAIPLLATLLAWGRDGVGARIEADIARSEALAAWLAAHPALDLKQAPTTGVINWRPHSAEIEAVLAKLDGTTSRTVIDGEVWARQVCANPHAELNVIFARIEKALS